MQIALQHPSFTADQAVICKLLCCSKTLQTEVSSLCACSLALNCIAVVPDTICDFAAWIVKHCNLVRSISWSMPAEPAAILLASQTVLARALQRATASSSGLQLQQYHCSCPAGLILSKLPAQHLTSLSFTFHPGCSPECDSIQTTIDNLAKLSNLRQLSIRGTNVGSLLQLQSLPSLTGLELNLIRNIEDIQHLPGQLKQLHITAVTPCWQERQPLLLSHLTALQDLQIQFPSYSCYLSLPDQPVSIQPGDVLPANLTRLEVAGDCHSSAPLLHLQHLQVLTTACSTMPARELLQLSRALTALRELHLCYTASGSADAAAAAWGNLPIVSLAVQCCGLNSCSVQQLPKLGSSLTSLDLWACGPLQCTAQQFGAVLRQLIRVEELSLSSVQLLDVDRSDVQVPDAEPASQHVCLHKQSHNNNTDSCAANVVFTSSSRCTAEQCSGKQSLLKAVATLPRLRSLCIEGEACFSSVDGFIRQHGPCPDVVAALQLAAATQLTHLTLAACGLQDEAVAAIAAGLSRLQELVLDNNPDLTHTTVAAVTHLLHKLRYLSLTGTSCSITYWVPETAA